MSEQTKIEWANATFNPRIGCTKVSPGCAHCYAKVSTPARALGVPWGEGKAMPPDNVWIGVSVENQEWADKRIPELLKIPAKVRFLSVEPLLGPVDLRQLNIRYMGGIGSTQVDWVIIGGESGLGARPCNIEWIRSLRDQCKAAGVPCFIKQLGAFAAQDLSYAIPESDITDPDLDAADIAAWEHHRHHAPLCLNHKKGGDPSEWPEDLRVREFPHL